MYTHIDEIPKGHTKFGFKPGKVLIAEDVFDRLSEYDAARDKPGITTGRVFKLYSGQDQIWDVLVADDSNGYLHLVGYEAIVTDKI